MIFVIAHIKVSGLKTALHTSLGGQQNNSEVTANQLELCKSISETANSAM
jgi:hypothetical protein